MKAVLSKIEDELKVGGVSFFEMRSLTFPQPQNAPMPIVWTEFPKVIFSRFSQELNASLPILFTELGTTMLSISQAALNAKSAIEVIDSGAAVARRVEWLLERYDLRADGVQKPLFDFITFADEEYRQSLERKALTLL